MRAGEEGSTFSLEMRRRGGVSTPPEKEGGGGVAGWRACREKRDRMAQWLAAEAAGGEGDVGRGEGDLNFFERHKSSSGWGKGKRMGPFGRWDLTSDAVSVCGLGRIIEPHVSIPNNVLPIFDTER